MEREVFERVDEVVKLVAATWRKYFRRVEYADSEDAISEGVAWVLENAWRYDPEKGSFATFVCMNAKNGIGTYLRGEWKHAANTCELEGLEEVLPLKEVDMYDATEYNVREVMNLCEGLDCKKRAIIEALAKGKSQTEVAREFGKSKQYISFTFNRFKDECNAKLKYEDGVVSEREVER